MAWGADNGAADELVDRLRACGARTCAIEADFQEAEVPARVFDQAHAALGPVTGLVLGHCESVASSILDTSLESFDRHFAVNTRAAWLLIRQHVTSILGTVENFYADVVQHIKPWTAQSVKVRDDEPPAVGIHDVPQLASAVDAQPGTIRDLAPASTPQ